MNTNAARMPTACLCAAWGLLVASGTWAQTSSLLQAVSTIEAIEATPAFRQFSAVEITGSSIVRKEQTQALPVQVITREDILRGGLKTVTDVVQSLPLMSNYVESAQLGMVAGGYSNAAIHGMPNGTLVLVDGLRLAPFGRQTVVGTERSSVDLSTLLLADVDRIEVLTDGASSLYGTDAIAGVVNIILRKERKGIEITADVLRPSGGAGQGWVSSIGWGHGQLQRDGYSLLVTVELSKRQELLGRDRPYASAGRYEFESGGQRYAVRGPYYTSYISPASLVQTGTNTTFVNSLYQDGHCSSESFPIPRQAACYRVGYSGLGIYPAEEGRRLHAHGERVLDAGHTVFADVLLGHQEGIQSNNWWPSVASAIGLTPGSEAYRQAVAAGMDPASTQLRWRPDLPAMRSASLQDNGRLQLGLRGEWQSWHYRSNAYFAQSRAQSLVDNFGNLIYDSLGLVNNGIWNNDNVLRPLDSGNPLTAQLETLRGGLKTASIGTTQLYGLQANGSRALAEINGKDVLLGLGVDLRTETSQFLNTTPVNLQIEPSAFDVRRQIRGVYGELQIPVTPAWEINLGARSDHYSDVGNTTNAKAFSRWAITPEWSMRGSIGSGFRAPTVAQTAALSNAFVWGQSNLVLNCNAQQQAITSQLGVNNGTIGNCTTGTSPFVLGSGNPNLKPEKSTQMTWGMAVVPHRNLRLAADLWSVRMRDTIQTLSDELVLSDPTRYAANYRLIPPGYSNNGTTPGALALYLPLQNLGISEKSGIDFEVQWRQPSNWGRWQLSAQATYLLRSRSKANPDAAYTSDLGGYDMATGTVSPRLRTHWMAGLTHEQWSTHLVMHHTSSYMDAPVDATNLVDGSVSTITRRVSSFTTWDLQVLYAANRQLDLRLGVRNLLNRQAPLSFAQNSSQVFGANTAYSNLWGRTLDLGMALRF
jgi:iron complex outermembrane recepter protein